MLNKNFASFFGKNIDSSGLISLSYIDDSNHERVAGGAGGTQVTNIKRFKTVYVKDEFSQDGITLIVGNGITPATINDIKIESQIKTLTPISSSVIYSNKDIDPSIFYGVNKTYKNNTSESITITEICLYTKMPYITDGRTAWSNVLLAREVIDPVIIAPGETYTFSINIDL